LEGTNMVKARETELEGGEGIRGGIPTFEGNI